MLLVRMLVYRNVMPKLKVTTENRHEITAEQAAGFSSEPSGRVDVCTVKSLI